MQKFVHLICDYEQGDLAWAEIQAALEAQAERHGCSIRSHACTVVSFDTISTGFAVAQLALAQPPLCPQHTIVFANTAPRKDRRAARKNNAGEGLLFAKLANGVEVLAVNSGHSLSFVREHIVELRTTEAPDRGSQFRSRDFFPQVIALLAAGDRSFLRKKVDSKKVVPAMPKNVVAYIDCFGNLKTSLRSGDPLTKSLVDGARVQVTVAGVIRTATIATGSFNVKEGDLAFAPGSSGHGRRFWELFKRGGSALAEFNHPAVGAVITVKTG